MIIYPDNILLIMVNINGYCEWLMMVNNNLVDGLNLPLILPHIGNIMAPGGMSVHTWHETS